MTLDQIRYFAAAGQHQHVGKAARVLRISPSAVSHAIAALESELGQALFFREGKGLRLTPQGNYFLVQSLEILQKIAHMKNAASAATVEFVGTLRIAASSTLISTMIAPAWCKVAAKHPRASVEFVEARSPQVLQLCTAGAVDLGVCFQTTALSSFGVKELKSGNVRLCARNGHPITKRATEPLSKRLANYPVIMPRPLNMSEQSEGCELRAITGIEPKLGIIYFDSYEVARSCVVNSLAWGAFPDWLIDYYAPDLVALDTTNAVEKYTVAAIWKKTSALSQPLKQLLVEASSVAQQ